MHLNWFDLCLIGVVFSSMILGIMRGFLKEIISLVSWLAAFFISILFTTNLAEYLGEHIRTKFLASITSFLLLFFITLIIGALINYIISHLAQKAGLSLADRALGSVFGVIRGIMISLLVVFLISSTKWQGSRWFAKSNLTEHLQYTSSWMQDRVIQVSKVTKGEE